MRHVEHQRESVWGVKTMRQGGQPSVSQHSFWQGGAPKEWQRASPLETGLSLEGLTLKLTITLQLSAWLT